MIHRLVIELNDEGYAALNDLMALTDLTASTVISRSVHVMRDVDALQRASRLLFAQTHPGSTTLEPVRWE